MRRKKVTFEPITYSDVVMIHERLVEDFAASGDPITPPGVRDPNLLHSAVGRLTVGFAGHAKYDTLAGLAASVFYGICQNHAFHNGNKRTALVAMLFYLDRNGYQLRSTEDELYQLVTRLASHTLHQTSRLSSDQEVEVIVRFIEGSLMPIDKRELPLRFRGLRSILVRLGCELDASKSGFITVRRTVDSRRWSDKIGYFGEDREVRPGVIKNLRRELHLDDAHGVDSTFFYRISVRPDDFIARYRGLLRQLAAFDRRAGEAE